MRKPLQSCVPERIFQRAAALVSSNYADNSGGGFRVEHTVVITSCCFHICTVTKTLRLNRNSECCSLSPPIPRLALKCTLRLSRLSRQKGSSEELNLKNQHLPHFLSIRLKITHASSFSGSYFLSHSLSWSNDKENNGIYHKKVWMPESPSSSNDNDKYCNP